MPGTMLVPLAGGQFAIVDCADAAIIGERNWSIRKRNARTPVAGANVTISGKSRFTGLHRFLWSHWGLPETPEIDHQNGNGLDCRRSNLRAATRQQNQLNLPRYRNNKSGVKGVSWDKAKRKWAAQIALAGKNHYLGRFDEIEQAAAAYREASRRLHGEFGRPE